MLGEPAFFASQIGTDSKRQTLFSKQDIAAVVRADGDNFVVFGEIADVAPVGMHIEHAVEPPIEIRSVVQFLIRDGSHACHHAHA